MTSPEMDLGFDIIYNDICSNRGPGLNTYEKSVILTLAQDDILASCLNPQKNKTGEGWDDTKLKHLNFNNITVTNTVQFSSDNKKKDMHLPYPFYYEIRSIAKKDTEVLYILYENVHSGADNTSTFYKVIPVSSVSFMKIQSKPYRYPPKNAVWRLKLGSDNDSKFALVGIREDELADNDTRTYHYEITYIRKPKPILIPGFYDEAETSIEGCGSDYNESGSNCELDKTLHHEVVQRAAEIAKAAYEGNLESQIALGQQSKTQIALRQ